MIPLSLALALLLVGGGLGFIAGRCAEACRRGGSLDLHGEVCRLGIENRHLRGDLPSGVVRRLPAQRNLSGRL